MVPHATTSLALLTMQLVCGVHILKSTLTPAKKLTRWTLMPGNFWHKLSLMPDACFDQLLEVCVLLSRCVCCLQQ